MVFHLGMYSLQYFSVRSSRNEGKVRALWARTENQELYRARIGSHNKLRLRSHGTGRIFDWTLYTSNRVKVSFCSDGTDNRIDFVKFVSVLSSYHAQNAS